MVQERRFKEAFSALSEAVKYKRESWQTWANYAHAAVQTRNHLQAARGICQVSADLAPSLRHVIMLTVTIASSSHHADSSPQLILIP